MILKNLFKNSLYKKGQIYLILDRISMFSNKKINSYHRFF
ncbi:hypothetical protein EU97_0970 [Prochlorococcus marinus str. MIT 9311]|nr:hypothetical protein EU97_0970 [Prochlorococcus marinus str. MIT 9311]